MRSTDVYCFSHCISVSSDLAIGYAPLYLAIRPHVENNYIMHAMGSTVRGSNASRGAWGFLFSNPPPQIGSVACPASYSIRTGVLPGRSSGRGAKLTTQYHRVSRLGMSGAIPLLPLFAFMACAGAAVYFNLYYLNCDRTVLWFSQVTEIAGFVVDSGRRGPSNHHPPNSWLPGTIPRG